MIQHNEVDSLCLQAADMIKKHFRKPSDFIKFFADLADQVHEHRIAYRFVGKHSDHDHDVHFLIVSMLRSISAAWIDNDAAAMVTAIKQVRSISGAEGYYQGMCLAMSAYSWDASLWAIDHSQIEAMTATLRVLLDVSLIMESIESLLFPIEKKTA